MTRATHYWRLHARLPERHREPWIVTARGKMNSIEIQFADGVKHIVSRNAVRRLPALAEGVGVDPVADPARPAVPAAPLPPARPQDQFAGVGHHGGGPVLRLAPVAGPLSVDPKSGIVPKLDAVNSHVLAPVLSIAGADLAAERSDDACPFPDRKRPVVAQEDRRFAV
jgi:hypothetical protein